MSPSKRTVVSTLIAMTTKLAEIPQMQRQVPQIQTLSTTVKALFNQATKHVEIPQTRHIDKVALLPVVMQRQARRSTR